MHRPIRGRSRVALEHYGLRENLVPTERYLADRDRSVDAHKEGRNLVGMAEGNLTTDHPSDSFHSYSEANSEIAVSIDDKTPMSACSDNISVDAAMSIVTATVETTVATIAPAPVVGAPQATSTQVPYDEVPESLRIPTLVPTESGTAGQACADEPSVILEYQVVDVPIS